MISIATIVEGHGEVIALPLLLRRISGWLTPQCTYQISTPIRVHRDRFLNRKNEFDRALMLAAGKSGENGWIFVLLDADDDCPFELARGIMTQAQGSLPGRNISVVSANREYEAWFIAASASLVGSRGFTVNAGDQHLEAERTRDAKGWMRARMSGGTYGETTDQPAFTAQMDLQEAFDRSRSFRKLCSEWQRMAETAN